MSAPVSDLVARLRETANRDEAQAVMVYVDDLRALLARIAELEAATASLTAILGEFVDRDLSYHGENIVIPTSGHGNAVALVRRARAHLAGGKRDG